MNSLITNAYQTFNEHNSTGMAALFTYPAQTVTLFVPMMFTTIFLIIALFSYFSQRRFSGRGDFLASLASASYVTFILSVLASLIPDFVNRVVLGVTLTVALIFTALLLVRER